VCRRAVPSVGALLPEGRGRVWTDGHIYFKYSNIPIIYIPVCRRVVPSEGVSLPEGRGRVWTDGHIYFKYSNIQTFQ
jgi:hypothetical protein